MPHIPLTWVLLFQKIKQVFFFKQKKITGFVKKYIVMADVHIPSKTRALRHLISLFSFFLFHFGLLWYGIVLVVPQVRAREVMLGKGAVERYMNLAIYLDYLSREIKNLAVLRVKFYLWTQPNF